MDGSFKAGAESTWMAVLICSNGGEKTTKVAVLRLGVVSFGLHWGGPLPRNSLKKYFYPKLSTKLPVFF